MSLVKKQIEQLIESGMTQVQISKIVGVSSPTISRCVTGTHSYMRSDTAASINDLHREVFVSTKVVNG